MFNKLFTGKLYIMGVIAHEYLVRTHQFENYRDNYLYCPTCQTSSTYKHEFWDCPKVKSFWIKLKFFLNNMNMTMPIKNYSDFITFINRSNLNDITTIVRDEIICNAIYAI